jgi:putative FmdB family regulatory protein
VPTYQYACTECGHAFDQVQSFSDASLTVCPQCGGRLRKVFSAAGVVFKGSGFYRTDSRSGSGSKSGSSSESGSTSGSTSGSGSGSTSGSGSSSSGGTSASSSGSSSSSSSD